MRILPSRPRCGMLDDAYPSPNDIAPHLVVHALLVDRVASASPTTRRGTARGSTRRTPGPGLRPVQELEDRVLVSGDQLEGGGVDEIAIALRGEAEACRDRGDAIVHVLGGLERRRL